MDPVTSIGLVSAILSFVTFGSKLVKGGVEIHREGNLAENATLEDAITRMDSFHSRLLLEDLPATKTLSDDEKDLRHLAEDCHKISSDLLRLLKTMKPRNSKGLQTAWGTVSASWKSIIHAKDKAELEGRLDKCYGRLTTILVWSTKFSIDSLISSAHGNSAKLNQIQTSIDQLKQAQQESTLAMSADAKVQQKMDDLQEGIKHQIYHARVLQALRYSGMNNRKDGLSQRAAEINARQKDFGGPFRWICEDEVVEDASDNDEERAMKRDARRKFATWLSSDSGIFHVAGKFGSGKSTLMQILFHHPSTQAALERWAGPRTLVRVNYFFSTVIGGAQQQLVGLTKTLLHDILQCCPDLTPILLPEAWNEAKTLPREAAVPVSQVDGATAMRALNRVFHGALNGTRSFCVFIDGLDEYKDQDGWDQADLVDLLHQWAPAGQSNVKLCVASREETAFFNKFCPDLTIRLHELTRYDMERFVEERLRKIRDAGLKQRLIRQIPQKAEGVFLWTQLVVGEIREDLEMGDGIELDMNLLDRFPAGLRPLLDRTVASISERYRRKAYLVFAILPMMERHMIPCSAVALSFINEYCKDSEFAYTLNPPEWETQLEAVDQIMVLDAGDARVKSASTQFRAWCKGLVESSIVRPGLTARSNWQMMYGARYPSVFRLHQVFFSHRSISEYFVEAVVQETLLKAGVTGAMVADAISQILLAEFCHRGPFSNVTYGGWVGLLLFLRHKFSLDSPPFLFLDRLQHVMSCRKVAILFSRTEHINRRRELSPLWDELHPRGQVLVERDCIGTVVMGEVTDIPWWDDKIFLWGPFFTAIEFNNYEYPRWKMENDNNFLQDKFRITATVYLAIQASHALKFRCGADTKASQALDFNPADHQHCNFLEAVMTRYQHTLYTQTTFEPMDRSYYKKLLRRDVYKAGSSETHLNIWQHYIIWQFTETLRRHAKTEPIRSSQTEEAARRKRLLCLYVTISRTVEIFLRLGANPRLLITSESREDCESRLGEEKPECRVLIFEFGDEENQTTQEVHHQELWDDGLIHFSVNKRPISLRDWIQRFPDIVPNKTAVLAMIDQKISEDQQKPKALTQKRVYNTSLDIPEETDDGSEETQGDKANQGQALQTMAPRNMLMGYLLSFFLGAFLTALAAIFL
ncbi:hypothetical protein QBC40DRAFT_23999 [Triangularia verruculosa]|uniref:Nephrocystin 3-like N-terminal domain-containing protein n=1 Tax=Triangularia verruculosa TaxID=2587418 RepID=A0AAN7AYA6_9PEZI|nr:hypothetical protein QBC40DRAFT_23999 [Triangularia verruculosa]